LQGQFNVFVFFFRIVGFFGLFGRLSLIVKDPAMIKKITIKDFEHFMNHDNHNVETDRLFSKSVLILRNQKWKDMRTMLSPIYTSSKMKYMYGLLTECMDEFIAINEDKAKTNGGKIEIETHDVFARITADGIATTALGFKGDCVKNKGSEIYKIADGLEEDFTNPTNVTLNFTFPKIFKLLNMQMFRKSIHDFFLVNVVNEIQRRREGKIVRPDVIQLLVQAKEGQLKLEAGDADELSYTESKVKKISNWTDEDLVAQAMVLFLGGFETTATLMQVISYELSKNPEIQQTLIDEVDEMLENLNGKTISYDQLNSMKFLEMVVNETLRKWPSFRGAIRSCNKDYNLVDDETGETITIQKGTDVWIPFGEIQMDPKYFPNPEKFDPYRFSDENKGNIQSGTFLPFGMGPRTCIGSRYALLEAKLLLFSILTKFKIEKCSKTPEKLTHAMGNSGYMEKIYVDLKLRK
jgi:cytochrome P450 family 9